MIRKAQSCGLRIRQAEKAAMPKDIGTNEINMLILIHRIKKEKQGFIDNPV